MVCLTRLFLGFITLLGFYSTVHSQLDETAFKSDAQCFGAASFVNATCPTLSSIALNNIRVGTRPTAHGCHSNETAGDGSGCCQSASDACEFDFPISDNVLYHDQCNGVQLCRPGVQRIDVIHGSCNTSVYPGFTQYMYFNYFCVSDNRISHMDLGHFTVEDAAVYIQSPNYPTLNISSSVSALSCSVETDNCNAIILVYVIERNLADVTNITQCDQTQSLSIIEEDGSTLVNWTCNDNTYTISQPLQTAGSYILVNLTNTMITDGGKFWIGFKASLPANLTLECPAIEKQDCFPTTSSTTTSTITTSTTASTTTSTTSDPSTTTSAATTTTSTATTTTTGSTSSSATTTSTSTATTTFSTTSTTTVSSTATTTPSTATTTSTSQATTTSGSASTLSTHSAANSTTHTTEINTTTTNNETVVDPAPSKESSNTTLIIVIICCIGAVLIIAVIIGVKKRRDCKKEKNIEPEQPVSKNGAPDVSLDEEPKISGVSETEKSITSNGGVKTESVHLQSEECNRSSDDRNGSHNDADLGNSTNSVEENGSSDSRHSQDKTSTPPDKDATDVSINEESIKSEAPEMENLITSNGDTQIEAQIVVEENVRVVSERLPEDTSESRSAPRRAWSDEEVTSTGKSDFKENTPQQLIDGQEDSRPNVEPVTLITIKEEEQAGAHGGPTSDLDIHRENESRPMTTDDNAFPGNTTRRRNDSAYVRTYKRIAASLFSDVTLAERMQKLQRSFLKRKRKVNPKR